MLPPSATEDQQAELIDLQSRRRAAAQPAGPDAAGTGQDDTTEEVAQPQVYAPKGCASNLTLSAETTAELLARQREKLTAPQDTYFEQLREQNRAKSETAECDMSGDPDSPCPEPVDRPEPPGAELDPDPWFARHARAHLLPRQPASLQPVGVGSASLPLDSASRPSRARDRGQARAAGAEQRRGRNHPAGGSARRGVARSVPRVRPRAAIALSLKSPIRWEGDRISSGSAG